MNKAIHSSRNRTPIANEIPVAGLRIQHETLGKGRVIGHYYNHGHLHVVVTWDNNNGRQYEAIAWATHGPLCKRLRGATL